MLLEVENLQVYYGKSNILDDVCLQVDQGEIVALLGRNGAGKTTTLRTIMGLTNVKNGSIRFSGTEISRMPARQRSLAGIGYVPQDKLLFSKMAVEENLKAASRKRRSPQEWEMVYELFPDLRERRQQKAGTLSGGQQQMLTIARALLTRPKLLLLDEPSTGLMPALIKRIAEVIRLLNRE
ncbi:MAG: ATP-binding cassette domain-containing protein, partial [Desulfobacterales bacterium]